jgi:hypothetical protein
VGKRFEREYLEDRERDAGNNINMELMDVGCKDGK